MKEREVRSTYASNIKISLCKIIDVKSKILDLGEYQKPVSLTSGI
jgi:hypothetical protein